jgi:hypothetical protein
MPATEIMASSAGKVGDKLLLVPTGQQGVFYAHIQDWITAKRKDKIPVKDISTACLVKGIKQWAVFEEKAGSHKVLTVFKIT